MKIIKLAAGVPDGFVKIRIVIDQKGNFERSIVREGKTTCKSGDDQRLLEDLLNAQIPGYFGEFGEMTNEGHTREFQLPEIRTSPVPAIPEEESPIASQPQQPNKQREYGA
jgi:hypothetical protein